MSDEGEHRISPVLCVFVAGFHHRKGHIVEVTYPELQFDDHFQTLLSTLSIPEGAHESDSDMVYFHVPDPTDGHTLFCVSSYRQVSVSKLHNPDPTLTRNSMQKSVGVVSRLPLYGHICTKVELITRHYFDSMEKSDFQAESTAQLLQQVYDNLDICLASAVTQQQTFGLAGSLPRLQLDADLESSQIYWGLSARSLISELGDVALQLFKLVLLERKILVYGAPALLVCRTILSLVSLFPC